MVPALVGSLLHSAVLSAAIYFASGYSLGMTMLVVAGTTIALNVLFKRVLGGTGVTTTTWETVVSIAAALVPFVLVWQRFGGTGLLAYIGTIIATSVVTMYI